MMIKNKIAVIRIRGGIGALRNVKITLDILRLYRKNYCIAADSTPSNLGMVKNVKDYVAWGEINDETFKLLVEKRGEIYKGDEKDIQKFIVINNKKYKKFFRLNSPKGGFERKGIKMPFSAGGVLGYRGKLINDLIKRMI